MNKVFLHQALKVFWVRESLDSHQSVHGETLRISRKEFYQEYR